VLGDRIEQVRASTRLTDSPACLVIPEGGLQPHIERLMRAQRFDVPVTKRILEINPAHPLIQSLARLHEQDAESPRVAQWMQLVYDQALLAEGSPVEDPSRLARSLSELLTAAASRAADG